VYSKLLKLRNIPNFLPTFITDNITANLGGGFKTLQVSSDSLKICVIGNFDVVSTTGSVTFQNAGTWYNYLAGGTRTATGTGESITLQPGEYFVYTNRDVSNLLATPIRNVQNPLGKMRVNVYPNPVNRSSTVEYDLPESGNVQISIVNIMGQKISTLFSGFKPKGTQRTTMSNASFHTQKLAPGSYLLKIDVNGNSKVQPFLIQN
jgi:hypothetical protein